MARDDSFFDPRLVATWRRMLWLMRGSADVVEALVPVAAGMTRDEISRLLARAGAPSGKGVEPVEQVLSLLGVVPKSRYDALLKEYEELGSRVEEAEQSIDRLRRLLGDQGLADEAEQLLDSWGGLVRRTLRAQAGFVRSIAGGGAGSAPEPPAAPPVPDAPYAEPESRKPAPRRRASTATPVRAAPRKAAAKKQISGAVREAPRSASSPRSGQRGTTPRKRAG
ncbi:MAG: hypothetical protein ACREQM_06455 [Candidatus Dormibacteraceae bacterium]